MSIFLLKVLPWILIAGLIFLCVKLFVSLADQKKKTAAEKRKSEKMKLNIDQLAGYQSADQGIRETAEKNIRELKEARSDVKVKEKLDKFYSDINSIYYAD